MPKSSSSGAVNSRVLLIAGAAVVLVVIGLALPRFLGGGDDVTAEDGTLLRDRIADRGTGDAAATEATPTTEAAPEVTEGTDRPAERIEVEAAAPETAGDDLDVAVRLRWESYPTGGAIHATVEITNRDDTAVWIPSPQEPQPTLALRVLDESGSTVRHVVEQVEDRLPRRMLRLEPGASATVALVVVDRGDEPLPPGRYQLSAAFDADKAWRRSGLPVWTAPDGARHSDRVSFDVTER